MSRPLLVLVLALGSSVVAPLLAACTSPSNGDIPHVASGSVNAMAASSAIAATSSAATGMGGGEVDTTSSTMSVGASGGAGGTGGAGGSGCDLTCTTPPAPACATATTLRTYDAVGSCEGGTCSYSFIDTVCAAGCKNSACNPTPPILSAGRNTNCAIVAGGDLKCWGGSTYGELGDNSTSASPVPVDVIGLSSGVLAVSTNNGHACAITSAGGVRCWGHNANGELGDGSTNDSLVPVDVAGLSSGVASVSVGPSHACAITSAGGVRCWGKNASGELGDGSTNDSLVPVDVAGLSSKVIAVSIGDSHSCAVTTAGAVQCWGTNGGGQLGNGSTSTGSLVPVDVLGLPSSVTALASGSDHTCALTSAGTVHCWGEDYLGQLGDNGNGMSATPIGVGLNSMIVAISATATDTCAVFAEGNVACWGTNECGQLGNGTTGERSVPVGVKGISSAVSVAVGIEHACVALSTGGVQCWGDDYLGELGDGNMSPSPVPVDVLGL